MMGRMWEPWGPHGQHPCCPRFPHVVPGGRQRRLQPWEPHGDLLGAMRMMWGQQE